MIRSPSKVAETDLQKQSIAELSTRKKYPLYEKITYENRENYFKISTYPITKIAEDDMELISDIITWGEEYLHNFQDGQYNCARCGNCLYSSDAKWLGPCVWPSFRKGQNENSLLADQVYPYYNYEVVVKELYCYNCKLFIGHAFEDGISKGDSHPMARWRH
jgi:peptide-methionine (R)-S-oxide reductase